MSTNTSESGTRHSGWLTLIAIVAIGAGIAWLLIAGGRTLISRMQFESEWQALIAPIEEKGGSVAWWTEYDPDEVDSPGEIAAAVSWRNSMASSQNPAATVTDDDVRYVAATFPKIYGLHLDGTQVTDEGLRHLHHMRALTRVTLNNTRVTQQGVNDLQAALPDCSIVYLNPLPIE